MKQPKDATINFRAPSALVEEARACARDWGVNVSEFIREAMSLQLNLERERKRQSDKIKDVEGWKADARREARDELCR